MGLSALLEKSRHAVTVSFLIFIFTFLFTYVGYLFIYPAEYDGIYYYADFRLYLIDLNYHFANIYTAMSEEFGFITTDTFRPYYLFKYDPEVHWYVKTNYFSPPLSALYLSAIAIIVLVLGIWRFKTRDLL